VGETFWEGDKEAAVVSTWSVLSDVLLFLKCDFSSQFISPYMVVQILNMAAPLITNLLTLVLRSEPFPFL